MLKTNHIRAEKEVWASLWEVMGWIQMILCGYLLSTCCGTQLSLSDKLCQLLTGVWFFATLRIAACQAPLASTVSWRLLKFTSTEPLMLFNHLIFCCPLLRCPQSRFFAMSRLFASGGQSLGASASVLPVSIQGWFPLGWTGLISLQSKGLLRICSSTTDQKICSLVLSLLYLPTLTSICDYWKNYSFDYVNICQQSDISVF